MPLEAEWTVNYTAKTVTHTSGTEVYTVLAFFQWLAAKFAAEAQMDDDYAFVSDTPTVFRFINTWAFGAPTTDFKFLKGGSIESSNAQELWANLYSIGDQYRSSMIYIVQSDAEVTPWWSPGNIDILILVKTGGTLIDSGNVLAMSRDSDCLFDHNFVDLSGGGRNPVGINTFQDLNYLLTGDIYLDVDTITGFDVGNYAYGVTSLASGRIQYVDTVNTRLYLCQVEGTFVISETINERTSRTGGDTGSTAVNDATTAEFSVIKGYSNVKYAFVDRKFSGGTTAGGPFLVGETITQAVSGATFLFVGELANELYVEDVSGTPNGTNQLTGGTSAATYTPTSTAAATTINKDLNNGAGPQPYRAVIDGAARSMLQIYQYLKYITAHNSLATINTDEGEEYRSALEGTYVDTKQAPFGTFAGGTFFGARGIWIEDYETAAFQLIDADGDQQIPPSLQKASVSHASLSGCRILIAERSGANIIKDQYTIASVTTTTIVVTATINANKVPQTGSLRVGDTVFAYTGFNAMTFTGVTPDPTGQSGSLYVPLLDLLADAVTEQSDNIIYTGAFDIKARVRKYGYKDFTLDTAFGAGGVAVTPILQTDPQAT